MKKAINHKILAQIIIRVNVGQEFFAILTKNGAQVQVNEAPALRYAAFLKTFNSFPLISDILS